MSTIYVWSFHVACVRIISKIVWLDGTDEVPRILEVVMSGTTSRVVACTTSLVRSEIRRNLAPHKVLPQYNLIHIMSQASGIFGGEWVYPCADGHESLRYFKPGAYLGPRSWLVNFHSVGIWGRRKKGLPMASCPRRIIGIRCSRTRRVVWGPLDIRLWWSCRRVNNYRCV